MSALQIATLDYDIKGEAPREAAHNLCNIINIRDEGGLAATGRAYVNVRRINEAPITAFKRVVKAYKKGNIHKREVKFPMRMGMVTYMDTIPTATHLNILFRHDSCVAKNFSEGEDPRNHFQPQVFFIVKIDLQSGDKQWHVVRSALSANHRMFPHNETSNDYVISNACSGEYSNQMEDSLKQDDLQVFLSVFSMYVSQGTNRDDEYGRHCNNFTEDRRADSDVMFFMRDPMEAKLIAYVMSDPEIPHGINMKNQKLTLTFSNNETHLVYQNEMCKLSTTGESND